MSVTETMTHAEIIQKKMTVQEKILKQLRDFVSQAPEKLLFHINVYKLAEKANIDRPVMLEAFIRGVKEGLFTLSWVYHCPSCGGVANEAIRVHEATHENYCGNCKVDFKNVLDNTVEVFFNVHPQMRNLPKVFSDDYLGEVMNVLTSGEYFIWKNEYTIRGVEVLQNKAYRELMGDDVLLDDQSLEIEHSAILFTDVKGSTQMYTKLGDAKAFQLVREHFRLLFNVIEDFDGVPVKTIGDAVMGVFYSRKVALDCTLEAQRRLQEYYGDKDGDDKIEVKMGIHTGTTIVVTLNDRVDYFGNTVNTAARIQGVSNPNEVVVSEHVLEFDGMQDILRKYNVKMKKDKTPFKGLQGKHIIYRLTF